MPARRQYVGSLLHLRYTRRLTACLNPSISRGTISDQVVFQRAKLERAWHYQCTEDVVKRAKANGGRWRAAHVLALHQHDIAAKRPLFYTKSFQAILDPHTATSDEGRAAGRRQSVTGSAPPR